MRKEVALYVDEALGKYGFPDGHPWGTDRQNAFWKEAAKQKLDLAAELTGSRAATADEIARFHGEDHVQRVHQLSDQGYGSIDYGDTPAFPGVYEATAHVVGAALDGLARVMAGDVLRTFQPIGGLQQSAGLARHIAIHIEHRRPVRIAHEQRRIVGGIRHCHQPPGTPCGSRPRGSPVA